MNRTALIVIIYALLVALGGLWGYLSVGSTKSLIMASSFSILLLLSSYLMYQRKKIGHYASFALTLLLMGFFTYRFAQTSHFFPSGIMSIITLVTLVVLGAKLKKLRA